MVGDMDQTANDVRDQAHHCADWVLLGGSSLFEGIVDYKVEEQIVAAQSTADFTTTLQMNEQFLVHELEELERRYKADTDTRTFLSSGWDALDILESR